MSITPIFLGKVSNDTLQLQTPDKFRQYLYSLKGQQVEVVVRLPKKERSNPQNRYMWGVVYELLSETTGYTSNEIHDAMRMLFLQDNLRKIPTLRSTTELTTIEMETYLENIRQWAAQELNCVIPEPNQVEV